MFDRITHPETFGHVRPQQVDQLHVFLPFHGCVRIRSLRLVVKDELVSRVRGGDPDDIPGVDVSLSSCKRAFAKFPRHKEGEESLFVDNLVDFLEEKVCQNCFLRGDGSRKLRTSNTTTHRFPSLSVRNSARVDVEGSSYGLIE